MCLASMRGCQQAGVFVVLGLVITCSADTFWLRSGHKSERPKKSLEESGALGNVLKVFRYMEMFDGSEVRLS